MKVALFTTCLVDAVTPQIGVATVTLLERLGCEVVVPEHQTCCGQMHLNSGYRDQALDLARRHVATFASAAAVVAPSGSCVACVRHQYLTLAARDRDHDLATQVAGLAARTYELTEFVVDVLGVTDVGAYFPHRVTYHPACHATRGLRLGDRPLRLLRQVRGIDLVALPDAESCCGFGGTFALKNSEVSSAMLADKVACITTAKAERCTAVDASCLLHIGGGLSRLQAAPRTIHIAEILASTEPAA